MQYETKQQPVGRRTILGSIAGVAGSVLLAACGGTSDNDKTATANASASKDTTVATTTAGAAGTPHATTGSASASSGGTAMTGKQVMVAATTTQIQDFVKNVGGNRVTVAGILKPNVDPHNYEPTVSDVNSIAKADVIFVHGVGLDSWIGKTITNANAKAPVVTTTDGVNIRKGDENEPQGDPHVWFDPTNVRMMVMNIASGLANVDTAGASVYQQNATAYAAQLTQMDMQVQDIYNQVPKGQRKLVTNHDAFQYLANHYGLTIVGAVIPNLSDTAEPSAKQVNNLIDTIKKEQVKAIFAESSANPKVAQQVAKETTIKIVDTLYGDTLGAPGSAGDTYLKMMVYNATTIVNAIK